MSSNLRQTPSVPLVLVFDDAHARHAAVVLMSAADTLQSGWSIAATLITSNLSQASADGLRRVESVFPNLDVRLVRSDASQYANWFQSGHISAAAYLRLELHHHLGPDLSRVVYLDTDVVCVDSIHELMLVDLAGGALGAVRDTSTPTVSSPRGIVRYVELGLGPDCPYFNSGVMLIDVPAWRHADPLKFGAAYVGAHGDVQQALDQELLNACFSGRWTELDLRWNVSPRLLSVDSWRDPVAKQIFAPLAEVALTTPAIVHFLGPKKPWHFRSTVAWRDRYMSYARNSHFDANRVSYLRSRAAEAIVAARKQARSIRRVAARSHGSVVS